MRERIESVYALDPEDVEMVRDLASDHHGLGARDLVHLAFCRRREIGEIRTHDRALAAASG